MPTERFQTLVHAAHVRQHRQLISFIEMFMIVPQPSRRLATIHRLADAAEDFVYEIADTSAARNTNRPTPGPYNRCPDPSPCYVCGDPACPGPYGIPHEMIMMLGLEQLLCGDLDQEEDDDK